MRPILFAALGWLILAAPAARAERVEVNIPVLVPLTGFLSLEGASQRNGALLALSEPPQDVTAHFDVADTGVAPESAVNALERALSGPPVTAIVASMLGTQMLAMLPIARERRVPLLTISGTAQITELGNPFVFRFFPGDEVTKQAHVRFAVEQLGRRRPAIVYQTTAYGQSGRRHIAENLKRLGVTPVFEEGLDVQIRDMSAVLSKARAADPDVVLLHLHSGPTALFVRQATAMQLGVPIVAGSAMHQPPTAALLEPAELKDVCAEANASPVSGGSPAVEQFLAAYRSAFRGEPDGFALAQYDGVRMTLAAVAGGARSAADIAAALSRMTYDGLAMTYRSDGKGNMAHSAVIVCYDGASRVPRIVKRYDNLTGALGN